MKYTEIKVTLENEDSAIFSQPLPKGSQILMFPRHDRDWETGTWDFPA